MPCTPPASPWKKFSSCAAFVDFREMAWHGDMGMDGVVRNEGVGRANAGLQRGQQLRVAVVVRGGLRLAKLRAQCALALPDGAGLRWQA